MLSANVDSVTTGSREHHDGLNQQWQCEDYSVWYIIYTPLKIAVGLPSDAIRGLQQTEGSTATAVWMILTVFVVAGDEY